MNTAPPFGPGGPGGDAAGASGADAGLARAPARPSSTPPYAGNRPATMPPYAVMPDGRARRVSAPPSGTAVERSGSPPRALLLVGGAAAGIGVLLAVLLARGGAEATPTPSPAPSQAPEVEMVPVINETPVAAPVEVTPVKAAAVSQAAAVEQLRRAFGKARLYSQISVAGDQLELRSSACEDQQLGDLLERSRTQLAESGLHRVRCLQPHGQVVFSREL